MDKNFVEKMLDDYKLGMSCKEIASKYNIEPTLIHYYKKQFNIPNRVIKSKRLNITKNWTDLTDNQQQILLGSLLGDGYLSKRKNSSLIIEHSLKQLDYLKFKHSFLKEFCHNKPFYYREKKSPRSDTICKSYRMDTACCGFLGDLRKIWYINNKKRIFWENVQSLKAFGLAIWYMDDGSYCRNGNALHIYTMGFTFEENKILCELLKHNFDLNFSIIKKKSYYYLTCYGDEMRKFKSIVEPYILPCFNYKIDIKDKKKLKFNPEEVLDIRLKYKSGWTQAKLAHKYNCAYQEIQGIVYNKSYQKI